jgi:hypothetical protein
LRRNASPPSTAPRSTFCAAASGSGVVIGPPGR